MQKQDEKEKDEDESEEIEEEDESSIRRFEEEYPLKTFEAEDIKIKEILNEEVTFKDFFKQFGEHGEFMSILIRLEGQDKKFATGSKVIMQKLEKAKNDGNFPIIGTIYERTGIESKKKYYDIK